MASQLFLEFISEIVDVRNDAADEGIEIFIDSFFFSPNVCLVLDDVALEIANDKIETLILRQDILVVKGFLTTDLDELSIAKDMLAMIHDMILAIEEAVSAQEHL